jgi:hypothetical protein
MNRHNHMHFFKQRPPWAPAFVLVLIAFLLFLARPLVAQNPLPDSLCTSVPAAKLATGQLIPDVKIGGTIASIDAIDVITIEDENGKVTGISSISVTYTKADGQQTTDPVVFEGIVTKEEKTLVIKDASNTFYAVDLETGGVALIGQHNELASKLLAGLNIYELGVDDASKAVTFSRLSTDWAFDEANDVYIPGSFYYSSYNKITYKGSNRVYPTPWQFLAKGGAPQKVKVTKPNGYAWADLKFVTSTGLELELSEVDQLNLLPAQSEAQYFVYAFLMNADGTATYCGSMTTMTRSIKTYYAKLVDLGGTYNLETLRTGLNNIYKPYGIEWNLSEDRDFKGDNDYKVSLNTILDEGVGPEDDDAFFSEYTPNQKALNSLYRSYSIGKSTYDDKAVYLFALPSGTQLGDMPIGYQWGYLFGNVKADILAHELGHGKLSLTHTFDMGVTQGNTENLMDYHPSGVGLAGTELVARQWLSLHDEAKLAPFQNDGDGAFAPIVVFLIKAGTNAIADFGLQAVCNYYFDTKCSDSWSCAMSGVNWLQVLRSAGEGAIPWKAPGGPLGKAAITASIDVGVNYTDALVKKKPYGLKQVGLDFAIGFIGQLAGDGIGELITKYGETGLKAGLKKLGLSDEFIESFIRNGKEGVFEIVKFKNLVPQTPSGNKWLVNFTKSNFDKFGLKIPKSSLINREKEIVETLMKSGDPDGKLTEELVERMMLSQGYQVSNKIGKYGSNNGFDVVCWKGSLDDPSEIIIIEAKQFKQAKIDEFDDLVGSNYDYASGLRLNPGDQNTGLPEQMSTRWVRYVTAKLRESGKTESADFIDDNTSKIAKYVFAVDKSVGESYFLKLANY